MTFCKDRDWRGLYRQSHDLWCPDAYSHPAKMAPALCFKIIEHLEELGLLARDSVILDPLAGIGTTALAGCLKGYRCITLELEPKFIALQEKNREYVERKTYRELDWEILQGDARKLSGIIRERCVAITSPPYQTGEGKSNKYSGNVVNLNQQVVSRNRPGHIAPNQKARQIRYADQGAGNIGNLPDRER